MKICIDLTSVSYHMSGIERYALYITEQMLAQDKVNSYILICRNSVPEILRKYMDPKRIQAIVLQGNNKILFNQIALPRAVNKTKADAYLFLAFTSPLLVRKGKLYNTIHDMAIWDCGDTVTLRQRLYFKPLIYFAAKSSKRVFTVSEFSRGRIAELLKVDKRKIDVIPSAIAPDFKIRSGISFEEVQKRYNLPQRYIMSLSTMEPRKNIGFLIEAFCQAAEKVNYDLVLVGRIGWKMKDFIGNIQQQRRIHFIGFVEDRYVSCIYQNALCFVFPSIYEGFGLPPLEALALGRPVISSNAASMPEVLQEQAVYYRYDDQENLRELLLHLEEKISHMPLGLNSYQKENFCFEKSAKKILDILSADQK